MWVITGTQGMTPGEERKTYTEAEKGGGLRMGEIPDGGDSAVGNHQDARMHARLFAGNELATLDSALGRLAYVDLERGKAVCNGRARAAGDALLYADEPRVEIGRGTGAEILVFDLPRLH